MLNIARILVAALSQCAVAAGPAANDQPLPAGERTAMMKSLDETIARFSGAIAESPDNIEYHSRRGDAYFFRGRFAAAVADYEKMAVLEPRLAASHWRRGLAYFYAGRYEQAARQFEKCYTRDNVDRENGIWQFFSQVKAHGLEKARQDLLKYEKADRQPFPAIYRLIAGKTTSEAMLAEINSANLDSKVRAGRLFYAHLYIGLNEAIVADKPPASAVSHLRKAVINKWPLKAGFGPRYMWHIGRLHYELVTADKSPKKK